GPRAPLSRRRRARPRPPAPPPRALRDPRTRPGALREGSGAGVDRRRGQLRAPAHAGDVVPDPRVAAEPRVGARPRALRPRPPQRDREHRESAEAARRSGGSVLDRAAERGAGAAGTDVPGEAGGVVGAEAVMWLQRGLLLPTE